MNSRILVYLLPVLLAGSFAACVPYEEEGLTSVNIDLKDSLYQRIYTFQHQQRADSLSAYLRHRDPTYRYLAVVAFGSFRDTAAVDTLAALLDDRVDEVRAAAAYALGQIGMPEAAPLLVRAFDRYDTAGVYRQANRAILEAIGKVGSPEQLQALASISTYQKTDTALLEGQAWGIYRFALRDIVAPEGTAHMLRLIEDEGYPVGVRLIAAHYLHRTRNLQIDSLAGDRLAGRLTSEKDTRIRMALATGVAKARTQTALAALRQLYRNEPDYRVKCNILNALSNFDYAAVQTLVLEALHDKNRHIAGRAAQYFLDNGIPEDATLYWRLTRDSLPWQAQIPMFAAALRHLPDYYADYRGALNAQVRRRFETTQSPFVQVAALQALTEFPWNFRYIYRAGLQSPTPIVRAAAIRALAAISENPRKVAGLDGAAVTKELAYYFQEAVNSGDPAVVGPAADALTFTARNYRGVIDSLDFLERALSRVDSTRDFFTYRSLRLALNALNGKTSAAAPAHPLRPIEWSVLLASSVEPRAIIRTTKGVIQLRLLPKVAPASVASFIQLAREGYYRNKYFYRVVPNFVIQGAQALDHTPDGFTLRSELPPLHYDQEGLLGMASDGPDTESTQFFITHSPTPHLDGRYTIFGRVVEGMEVVHQIQIGDQIEDIVIQ